MQGWTTLSPFDAGTFVDAYILLPLFALIYVVFKRWNDTEFKGLEEIDLNEGRRIDVDDAVEGRVIEASKSK